MDIRIAENFVKKWGRRNWPSMKNVHSGRVAIVFANYNTFELTSYLLFSLFRILGTENVSRIIAVDNNSTDGSKELLEKFAGLDMIDLISNRKQNYHGPAINQAIRYLAAKERQPSEGKRTRYIWILDSDVIILSNNTITDAVNFIKEQDAAAVGQFQYDALPEGYAHISSLLIDPGRAWKRNIEPFDRTGAPAANFQRSLRAHGLKVCDFPFRTDGYLLHLARGTLKAIHDQDERDHRQYQWAATHAVHHYHGDPSGPMIHERFLEIFGREVPELTSKNLLDACLRPERIKISLPPS